MISESSLLMQDPANENLDGPAAVAQASSVAVVQRFMDELRDTVTSVQREEAVRQLQSLFIMRRLDTASMVEAVRGRALQQLMGKLDNMPTGMLLKTIESLSNVGEPDIAAVTGVNTKGGGGININNILQNKNASMNAAGGASAPSITGSSSQVTSATIQDGVGLLEALEALTRRVGTTSGRVIDADADAGQD